MAQGSIWPAASAARPAGAAVIAMTKVMADDRSSVHFSPILYGANRFGGILIDNHLFTVVFKCQGYFCILWGI
ncbi:MAG: hypothetical protein R3C40_07905 [Parvularculaceae bacterium]